MREGERDSERGSYSVGKKEGEIGIWKTGGKDWALGKQSLKKRWV